MSFRGVLFRGSPKDTCTFGEKEHASKRVSIIVPDNAISKTKRATRTRPRVNLQRTSKIHQILAFLGENFFGIPAGYCVPVGHMVAFLQCVKHSIWIPAGYCVPVGINDIKILTF